jgi:hypothetical protein
MKKVLKQRMIVFVQIDNLMNLSIYVYFVDGDIIDNIIEPHTSCSMNDQQFPISSQDLAGQQAQQNSTVRGCRLRESENFPRSSPIPQSAVLRPVRHELNTRENRLSSIENTSTVSIRESTCTLRKKVQSSENPPDDNFHQQATPTTTASSRPRPQDQPRMLERPTCSAICNNDSSCNGSKEKCPVRFCSRTLPHEMCNMGYLTLTHDIPVTMNPVKTAIMITVSMATVITFFLCAYTGTFGCVVLSSLLSLPFRCRSVDVTHVAHLMWQGS